MNIKEALVSGVSAEELKSKLEAEIEAAKKEIEEQNKKEMNCSAPVRTIETVRRRLVEAAIDYMDIMDWINMAELSNEDINDYCEMLAAMEAELDIYASMLHVIADKKEKRQEKECKCGCGPESHKTKDIDARLNNLIKNLI